jgi:hypothetical protein
LAARVDHLDLRGVRLDRGFPPEIEVLAGASRFTEVSSEDAGPFVDPT